MLNNTHNYKDATLNVMTAKELTAAAAIRYKKGGAFRCITEAEHGQNINEW